MEEKKQKDGFKQIKAEYKKITWPNRKELFKQTKIVVFTTILISLIIFGFDMAYNFLFSLI